MSWQAYGKHLKFDYVPQHNVQSLEIETDQTVLFWDFSWYKTFVCVNCELYLYLEYAHKTPRPTGFEKSKIHQPNPKKL